MIDEALFDAEEKMEKAVSVARDDLSTIRTGRANPGMFSRIVIDYYGTNTPITQLASTPLVLLASNKSGATRVQDLIATIKSKPDAVSYGTSGNGTSQHLTMLSAADLVRAQREGRNIRYFAELSAMRDLLGFLMHDCCGRSSDACSALLDAMRIK